MGVRSAFRLYTEKGKEKATKLRTDPFSTRTDPFSTLFLFQAPGMCSARFGKIQTPCGVPNVQSRLVSEMMWRTIRNPSGVGSLLSDRANAALATLNSRFGSAARRSERAFCFSVSFVLLVTAIGKLFMGIPVTKQPARQVPRRKPSLNRSHHFQNSTRKIVYRTRSHPNLLAVERCVASRQCYQQLGRPVDNKAYQMGPFLFTDARPSAMASIAPLPTPTEGSLRSGRHRVYPSAEHLALALRFAEDFGNIFS